MVNLVKVMVFYLFITIINVSHARSLQAVEQTINDAIITTKIMAKFTEHTLINPLKIFISTQNGTVKLRGHINDKHTLMAALYLIKATPGVLAVDTNELVIQPVNTIVTDAYITARVEVAILAAKVLDDESIPLVGIAASTDDSCVTLTGSVHDSKSMTAIIKRVAMIKGVKTIIAHFTIAQNN
jgi:hyperosmotically inducible protein